MVRPFTLALNLFWLGLDFVTGGAWIVQVVFGSGFDSVVASVGRLIGLIMGLGLWIQFNLSYFL